MSKRDDDETVEAVDEPETEAVDKDEAKARAETLKAQVAFAEKEAKEAEKAAEKAAKEDD